MERFMFVLKVLGMAVGATAIVVGWGIVIANGYGISDTPFILLSSINAIAVVSLACFTYSYMKSNAAMAEEMKFGRDMEFEMNYKPKVILDFEVRSNGLVYIVITNEGNGAAKNIRFDIKPALQNTQGWDIDRWPPLRNGINYLAPKKKLTFFFDTSINIAKYEAVPRDFAATIEYEWSIDGKPRIIDKYPLELSPYLRTDLSSYKDISTLIDEVQIIRKELQKRPTRWAPANQG